MQNKKAYQYWDKRANMVFLAGTNDIILKKLEIEAIASHVNNGMRILELGCGNGITAIELAKRFDVKIQAYDYSVNMVREANKLLAEEKLQGAVSFDVMDINEISYISEKYDLIYTERVLINLKDWEQQQHVISCIITLLRPGGVYLMCESCMDGLKNVNKLRTAVGLGEITPPWHNRYLCESEIGSVKFNNVEHIAVSNFSSTYYFLSRVINAWQAKQEGREPSYEAPINQLAFSLPPIGNFGQTKMWIWKKITAKSTA